MGVYIGNHIYLPDLGERGWDDELNENLGALSNAITNISNLQDQVRGLNLTLQELGAFDLTKFAEKADVKTISLDVKNLTVRASSLDKDIANVKVSLSNLGNSILSLDEDLAAVKTSIRDIIARLTNIEKKISFWEEWNKDDASIEFDGTEWEW